jgi:hypothetical protein
MYSYKMSTCCMPDIARVHAPPPLSPADWDGPSSPAVPPHHLQHEGPLVAVEMEWTETQCWAFLVTRPCQPTSQSGQGPRQRSARALTPTVTQSLE